ncbi:MAG: NUDIX hydrolase [Ruminococcaceae bacterium]|nr:NUDIX hydrolase [Oscillospiraceae bacterium]
MSNQSKPLSFFEEKQNSSELIFDGKVLHVYKDNITLPNGAPAFREYIKHIGAVCVVALTDDNDVICVRQFRYPNASVMFEIPAGKLDYKEEDPREAAIRELREETGAICKNMTYLGIYLSSPAILDEKIHMFLAEGLEFGQTDPDDDEFIETVKIPLDTLVDMIMRGEVPDGKTQAAVMRVAHLIDKRSK